MQQVDNEADFGRVSQGRVGIFVPVAWRIEFSDRAGSDPIHSGPIVGLILFQPAFPTLFPGRCDLAVVKPVEIKPIVDTVSHSWPL